MRDFRNAKAMARALRAELASRGVKLSVSESLELVARLFGVADWNTLAALIAKKETRTSGDPLETLASRIGSDHLLAPFLTAQLYLKRRPSQPPHPGTPAEERPSWPSLSAELLSTLHRTVGLAHERSHEFSTLEHLLLALLDDEDARSLLDGCDVDIERLRITLVRHVAEELGALVFEGEPAPKPTAGFHRVIQRAFLDVQSNGRSEINGADVLVAIFAETESHACFFLHEQGITRSDAVDIVAQRRRKGDPPRPPESDQRKPTTRAKA